MKRIMTVLLALAFLTGTTAICFGQQDQPKAEKKKKSSKKKGSKKKAEEPKAQ